MSLTEKKITASSLIALQDALSHVFWTKRDLRKFIELTIQNPLIVATIDWNENTKIKSVSDLITRMNARLDIYQKDLLMLIKETANLNDFSHLKMWDNSAEKIERAEKSVEKLRNQIVGYFDAIEELQKAEQSRLNNQAKITESLAYQQKLEELKKNFSVIAMNSNHQERGYQLEKFLKELFIFFDLDFRNSFKITGEQIDGAFTFDNADYLVEAKWQKKPIGASELYSFAGKIIGKLKNTLGLYISIEGYSPESLETKNPTLNSIILMDGADLMQVLEARITLTDMLYLKRRHASQTGDIFHKIV